MKKNLLTVAILALTVINTVLLALLVFVIVPTSNKTNQMVGKVAQIVDLELESEMKDEISIGDIKTYDVQQKLTVLLKDTGKGNNYAQFYMTLSVNSKHEDTEKYFDKIVENERYIMEIADDVFSQYTKSEVDSKKNDIRDEVLKQIQDLFASDFIINISFGNIILE